MIETWLVRGDTHGDVSWIDKQLVGSYKPEVTAVIILGDFGINFWLNNREKLSKEWIEEKGYYIYAVRGNHECRPQNIEGIKLIWDDEVGGNVYVEPQYPHIRYFMDYGIYNINGYSCLVIGGAYSVDKEYRLARGNFTEETNIPTKSGWFPDEQLNAKERINCELMLMDSPGYFDFVLTHTCPISFQPRDKFLSFVDQSKVDNSMEIWLEERVAKRIAYGTWLAGHYHIDRIEAPFFEFYYNDIDSLDEIYKRWDEYSKSGYLPWYIEKGPNFL